MARNINKITLIIVAVLFLSACSGYRYSMVEDSNAYFLKGEHYNNNPFIKVKAIIPNSYLVKRTENKTASKEDIKSTNNYGTKITDGTIIDRETEVEINLVVHDPDTNQARPSRENGTYKLTSREQVEDVNTFLERNYKHLYEKLSP